MYELSHYNRAVMPFKMLTSISAQHQPASWSTDSAGDGGGDSARGNIDCAAIDQGPAGQHMINSTAWLQTQQEVEAETARVAAVPAEGLVVRLNSLARLLDALAAQESKIQEWWQEVSETLNSQIMGTRSSVSGCNCFGPASRGCRMRTPCKRARSASGGGR